MLRIIAIISLFILILVLCTYAAWKGPTQEVTSWEALAEPERYDGLEIASSYNRVIGGLGEYIVVGPFGHRVNLKVDSNSGVKPNDFVSYRGIVSKEGYIIVTDIYVHQSRSAKYLASLILSIILLVWFFKKYRFNFRKFYFEKR